MKTGRIAIIGGGYSGTLQAIELLRRGAALVTLIERSSRLARGAAYGTAEPVHLLNVRAGRMSAFADEPGHFAAWLAERGGGADDFAQRRVYGTYVEQLLAAAREEAGDRLEIVSGDAVDLRAEGGGEVVELRGGGRVEADRVILSLGNLAPTTPPGIDPDALSPGAWVADPWRGGLLDGLSDADTILLVGTGLTAIDAALTLDEAGFRGRILALSRRGLVPRAHGEPAPHPVPAEAMPPGDSVALLRSVRRDAAAHGWHHAVDRLRSVTQSLWVSAAPGERRRFLRHLRPWWDVHRHRIAPAIAARIARMEAQGRLAFAAGRIVSVAPGGDGVALRWRPRGSDETRVESVRRIVNCTGPSGDIRTEPLLANLLSAGRIRPDPVRIGVDVDAGCRTIDAAGRASPSLYAIGPLTRGAFWEMVAVPDLRGQVRDLAAALAG